MARRAVDARDARIFGEWITGHHESFRRAVFCAPGAPIESAAAAMTVDDVLLVPSDAAVRTEAHIVRYEGEFDVPGDVLHVAGHSVELQHYAAAAYVELVGPTAMRFLDADGWRAFLADADLARTSGVFTPPMIDQRLRLADAEVLADPFAAVLPRALHVHADGRVALGAQGAVVGVAGEVAPMFLTPRPRGEALFGITAPVDVAAGLAARPWLGRYANAAELKGLLESEGSDLRIDGFGWSALRDFRDAARADADAVDGEVTTTPRSDDPFLVWSPDGVLLVDLRTRRRQRLPEPTVRVVAALQSSDSASAAADRLVQTERLSGETARRLCAEAEKLLGVHFGVRADGNPVAAGVGA